MVVAEPRAVVIPDVEQEPRYIHFEATQGIQSMMLVPLEAAGRLIGVLTADKPIVNGFSNTDLVMLTTLADQSAVAIENARLYAETQRRLREQSLLYQAGQAISSSLEYYQVAETVTEQLIQATNAQVVIIQELRPKLNVVPGLRVFLQNPPLIRVGGHLTKSFYQYTLQGADIGELYRVARDVQTKMSETVFLDPVAEAGGAPVAVDHVTKTREGRGRYAYGSERKQSGTDVHLSLVSLEPFGRGTAGASLSPNNASTGRRLGGVGFSAINDHLRKRSISRRAVAVAILFKDGPALLGGFGKAHTFFNDDIQHLGRIRGPHAL